MAKNYQAYKMFDFITDECFKSWVLEPKPESNFFWQSWIDSHPEKADEIAKAREFILSVKFKKYESLLASKEAMYKRVMEKSRHEEIKHLSRRYSFTAKRAVLKAVAAVALLLTLSYVAYFLEKKEYGHSLEKKVSWKTKITRRGEKLTFVLPDGSMVKLNSESSLRYPTAFAAYREVFLQGEAFFEVERDTLKPFLVKTGNVTTEVLGTSFNVNYIPGDSMVQVAVTSGKVAVSRTNTDKKAYLLPTEVLTYEPGSAIKTNFKEEELLGWKDGILFFENANLVEITRTLSAWYDVDFEIRGEPKVVRKFSGRFKNKSLRYVLKGIAYSSNFDFTIQKNLVIINLK